MAGQRDGDTPNPARPMPEVLQPDSPSGCPEMARRRHARALHRTRMRFRGRLVHMVGHHEAVPRRLQGAENRITNPFEGRTDITPCGPHSSRERGNMLRQQLSVAEWNRRVGHPAATRPTNVSMAEAQKQARFITEEGVTEYLEAVESGDLIKINDALGDALWIVLRGFAIHGMDAYRTFDAIRESNYSKFDEYGNPVPHPTIPGKIGKSEFFTEPNLAPIIEQALSLSD
ncbi:MAG: hypothetical protein ACTH4Y_08280 [Microbacterium gubbeenense]|uniref:hypothetical protein n=1 Tax=Microbacterium gubbeenense TaxID=159896 RepID=UPI003F9D71A1